MKQLIRMLTITLLLVPALMSAALAQFDVSGTVKSDKGEPLIGVTVAVKNTNTGSTTDMDGKYIIHVFSSSGTLIFSYVGYSTVEKPVTSAGAVDVTLTETTSNLEEVIVSGLATTVKRTNAANAVAQISAKELTGITTQSTFDGALQGKFPGVQITSNTGAPGGGINIRMRGLTSIGSPAQPLFIIDGVYIDNSSISAGLNVVSNAAAGGNTAVFDQDNPSNRIADLDPGDFQSVEILKGASAAAIYGARASGGVVIINTKRGKENPGGPQISFSQSLGWQQILNPLGVRQWDETKIHDFYFQPSDTTPEAIADAEAAAQAQIDLFHTAQQNGTLHDYEDELFGNHGIISDSRLSVSSGNEKTGIFASGFHRDEEGIVENTGYTKTGLRLNVDHVVSKMLEVNLSSNYLKTSADRGFFNNDNTGTTMSIALSSTPPWAQLDQLPDGSYPSAAPYAASNFLQTGALITNNEAVDRFIVGGTVTAKIINTANNSLKLILQGGLDDYTLHTTAIFPKELQFESNGHGTNGASIQGTTGSFNNNESAFLVHTYYASKLTFRTQFGLTRESFKRNSIIVTATQLIGSQTNINQAGSVATYQNRTNQLDLGGFGQEEVNWNDQVIVTLGLRADKSSNDADPNELFYYPKASLAINIAKFDFWKVEKVNTLKLRAAYGESSNFPPTGALFTNLGSNIIDGLAGSLVNVRRGNPDINPERQKEFEVGADLGIIQDRVTLEATFYTKDVKDLIFLAQLPPSTGFTSELINGGSLRNRGVEIGLNADVVKAGDFEWFSSIQWWKNRSEITELKVPAFIIGSFGATLGTFYIDTNQSATQIVGIGYDSLKEAGQPYQVFGDVEPDFQMSFYEEFRYKGWELDFLIHWKKGGENVNLTALLTDLGGTSHDYDEIDLDPSGQLGNAPYRISQLGVSAAPFVESSAYVRVREVGLYYNFDEKKLAGSTHNALKGARIGVAARNPLNWFKYNSYDPEVSNFVNNGLSTGVEVNPFPSAKQFYATVTLNF
ncbi:MAG TPA: SusC/RagA family TonB-linked outer membrane protein [Chitinophagales bacterium]|nr:SusC/RagA family TonB-linked outer membrane protein [Chitinophagales bacterium]